MLNFLAHLKSTRSLTKFKHQLLIVHMTTQYSIQICFYSSFNSYCHRIAKHISLCMIFQVPNTCKCPLSRIQYGTYHALGQSPPPPSLVLVIHGYCIHAWQLLSHQTLVWTFRWMSSVNNLTDNWIDNLNLKGGSPNYMALCETKLSWICNFGPRMGLPTVTVYGIYILVLTQWVWSSWGESYLDFLFLLSYQAWEPKIYKGSQYSVYIITDNCLNVHVTHNLYIIIYPFWKWYCSNQLFRKFTKTGKTNSPLYCHTKDIFYKVKVNQSLICS